jgi:hypothetical protein
MERDEVVATIPVIHQTWRKVRRRLSAVHCQRLHLSEQSGHSRTYGAKLAIEPPVDATGLERDLQLSDSTSDASQNGASISDFHAGITFTMWVECPKGKK